MELLAIALAPSIAIIIYILYSDKFNREPATVMFVSFLYGVLSIVPAIALESAFQLLDLEGVEGTVIFAFLGVALVEEFVKFVPLRLYSFTRRSFDEPLDGIVHGVMIGLGFATLENILYVFQHGMDTGWERMFTAVPGHASWGVIMGFYFGKAKFNYQKRASLMITGLLLASFFHGLYDACLFLREKADEDISAVLILAAFTTHIVAVILAARLMRQHSRISKGLYKNAPVLTMRNATSNDIPLIRTLAQQIWPQSYEKILSGAQVKYMMKLIYSEAALQKQMSEGHQFIIVYNNAIPVGFASFGEMQPGIFKLHKIYLLPNQQGRGLGKFTIEQVRAEIQPRGATALRLNVNRNNKAKSFYEKLGFAVIKEEKIDIGGGYFMDDYIMEKNLLDNTASIEQSIRDATQS